MPHLPSDDCSPSRPVSCSVVPVGTANRRSLPRHLSTRPLGCPSVHSPLQHERGRTSPRCTQRPSQLAAPFLRRHSVPAEACPGAGSAMCRRGGCDASEPRLDAPGYVDRYHPAGQAYQDQLEQRWKKRAGKTAADRRRVSLRESADRVWTWTVRGSVASFSCPEPSTTGPPSCAPRRCERKSSPTTPTCGGNSSEWVSEQLAIASWFSARS
jgi:hypothetical protein